MNDEQREQEAQGRRWGYTASEALVACAAYLRSLPDDAWGGPTGCADWDERTLSGHILGEAVWFPNLLRGVIHGEAPHPASLYEAMKEWSPQQQIDRLIEASAELRVAIDEALPAFAERAVDVGWTSVPLWQAMYVILMESLYHDWDTRAGREPEATIATPWAVQLAKGLGFSAPLIAHHDAVEASSGRYLLQVGDGVGPLMIVALDGAVTLQHGNGGSPDVTVHLTADQCVRLIAGRFSLAAPSENGSVRVEGDRRKVESLNAIFGGIANG